LKPPCEPETVKAMEVASGGTVYVYVPGVSKVVESAAAGATGRQASIGATTAAPTMPASRLFRTIFD